MPAGSEILGSEAFPGAFVELVKRLDPAGLILGQMEMEQGRGQGQSGSGSRSFTREGPLPEPSEKELSSLRPLLSRTLGGKRILNISGGIDKLVPYHRGEVFLNSLKKALAGDGWFGDGGVSFEDVIDQSAGHEVTGGMVDVAMRFIVETLAMDEEGEGIGQSRRGSVRESKI